MSSVYVVCWIFLETFQTYFCMQADSVEPDQTDLEEQSDLGSHCLQKWQADDKAESCCDWQFKGNMHSRISWWRRQGNDHPKEHEEFIGNPLTHPWHPYSPHHPQKQSEDVQYLQAFKGALKPANETTDKFCHNRESAMNPMNGEWPLNWFHELACYVAAQTCPAIMMVTNWLREIISVQMNTILTNWLHKISLLLMNTILTKWLHEISSVANECHAYELTLYIAQDKFHANECHTYE